jgi:molybdate/tungstate transport system substrate-binding protein
MVYGVTIPKNAPNPSLARAFIHYLMDKNKGLKVLANLGQPTVVPTFCPTYDKLPDELRPYAKKPEQRIP